MDTTTTTTTTTVELITAPLLTELLDPNANKQVLAIMCSSNSRRATSCVRTLAELYPYFLPRSKRFMNKHFLYRMK
jgi:hypothetical protein